MEQFEPTAAAIDRTYNHRDTVVNGIRWHYVDEGKVGGVPVLFLHGLPEGWYSWRYVLPQIDDRYRCIAVDMKGYGRSDKKNNDYDWHVVALQLKDFMVSLGINRFFVVGHDWGSIIGSVLVTDYPDRVMGFVRMQADLIPRGFWFTVRKKPQFLLFQSRFLGTLVMKNAGRFIDTVYPPRMETELREIDRNYFVYEFSRPGVAEQVPRYFQWRNFDREAAFFAICRENFRFPVLVLQADRDQAQPPRIFADAASRCRNVTVQWITGAGHYSNLDQPFQVADAINSYLKSISYPDLKQGVP